MIYICKPCNAYCGTHKGTNVSLGSVANKELRELRKIAHLHFDGIWKSGKMKRRSLYKKLSEYLCLDERYTHMAMFDEDICKKVIEYSKLFGAELS